MLNIFKGKWNDTSCYRNSPHIFLDQPSPYLKSFQTHEHKCSKSILQSQILLCSKFSLYSTIQFQWLRPDSQQIARFSYLPKRRSHIFPLFFFQPLNFLVFYYVNIFFWSPSQPNQKEGVISFMDAFQKPWNDLIFLANYRCSLVLTLCKQFPRN